mgnify:CR=1 FL=1
MTQEFSSPLRGSYLSTEECEAEGYPSNVFVPSTGFLSIYIRIKRSNFDDEGFRPLNGVLIYLLIKSEKFTTTCNLFSSPQRGSYLSTHLAKI